MRIGIVNDLALAREVLRRLVTSVAGYTIAWTAEDGAEAIRKATEDRPDVILMDLVMPVTDGVEATRRIMTENPCPILLVTSSVTGNFDKVYRAMGYGGLDAVNTPVLGAGGRIQNGEQILLRIDKLARIKAQAHVADLRPAAGCAPRAADTGLSAAGDLFPLLVLGASTGGPQALAHILGALPADFRAASIVIQHIGAEFAPSLARWLGGQSALSVRLVVEGEEPKAGDVFVAATDDHLILRPDRRLAYTADPADCPYRPSVDVFFESLAAGGWPRPGIAVLLTGMGSDGARGLAHLRQRGWLTIAQDQLTSVVFGMPKTAVELNAACQVLPLCQIAPAILAYLNNAVR
ncbi:MAG TPA: chemotaxis-specific protein-glutamate methyltransferase CheB [Gemmataceae bacterium]|jgi:two-component system response regulator WspF|nr:chemotaxis-specific protein-glutamate methyltransferase CheB [Gemmataceae bacterium]